MHTSSKKQNSSVNGPLWYFLGEYSLSEFMPDHGKESELAPGLLCQTLRALGIPTEFIENIESTLTGFARESPAYFQQEMFVMPERIRVFCQKKMIVDASSEKPSNLHNLEQALEHERDIRHSDLQMKGGWGYFFIERGKNFQNGGSVHSLNLIDLYLYKEGD